MQYQPHSQLGKSFFFPSVLLFQYEVLLTYPLVFHDTQMVRRPGWDFEQSQIFPIIAKEKPN